MRADRSFEEAKALQDAYKDQTKEKTLSAEAHSHGLLSSEAINLTQHLMPDGRMQEIFIDRPQDIDPEVWSKAYEDAETVRRAGYSFHAEMLSDYSTISLTCVGYHPDIDEENDITILLAGNGPSIPSKVVELIDRSMKKLQEWNIIGEEPD